MAKINSDLPQNFVS